MIIAPSAPLDPWNLISPKKIISMILALSVLQAFGSAVASLMGARTGATVTGFLGGIISSTATTASLARRSKLRSQKNCSSELIVFLSATLAMLFEALILVIIGTTNLHLTNLTIFIGPIIATLFMLFFQYQKREESNEPSQNTDFKILPILQLTFFIVVILSISKTSQILLGENGLFIVTSLVSLFEIHGSIIANVQMHEMNNITPNLLSSLLAISIFSSYLSKFLLILTLGSRPLKSKATKCIMILFFTLALSWLISVVM